MTLLLHICVCVLDDVMCLLYYGAGVKIKVFQEKEFYLIIRTCIFQFSTMHTLHVNCQCHVLYILNAYMYIFPHTHILFDLWFIFFFFKKIK